MSTWDFYRTVMKTSGKEDPEMARRVTAAVLHVLRDRLTPEEADQAMAQLPAPLKAVWQEGDRAGREPTKLHLTEFLDCVRDAARLPSTPEARWMTLAVFAALKEQLTPGESEDVWAQLPKDLKEIWMEATAA